MKLLLVISVCFVILSPALPQNIGDYLGDETAFYAETKQVNQFFRRFNAEEDKAGKKLSVKDKRYHSENFRKEFIQILFDSKNQKIEKRIKDNFIRDVTSSQSPFYLDFHGNDWFSEVSATFLLNRKSIPVRLFLKLEKENLGYKWVIKGVYADTFAKYFVSTKDSSKFLHPLSHELDFMNLVKVFRSGESITPYTEKEYKPDLLTLFIYEFKKGNLQFSAINEVKFHFFQIDNWYFELSEFNREGLNRGWLISNILPVTNPQKEKLLNHIFGYN